MEIENNWSCLAKAFAVVLDLPVLELIGRVGHDGSEILWPELPEPNNRRGFHIQEMIWIADGLGFTVTPFEARPVLANLKYRVPDVELQMPLGPDERMLSVMLGSRGVVTGITKGGQGHATAWIGNKMAESLPGFRVACFWAVKKTF